MELYTKSGELSAYGYACGYVNRVEKANNHKQLYHEHNTFHVRANISGVRTWECFETLKEAKKLFNTIKLPTND
jgi:hypothetical protein